MSKQEKYDTDKIIEIMHFIQEISVKIHGNLTQEEIFKTVVDSFAQYNYYDAISILLLEKDKASLRVVDSSLGRRSKIASRILEKGEKLAGTRMLGYKIDLTKSKQYHQVALGGKTLYVNVSDLIRGIMPDFLCKPIIKLLNYKNKGCILTPLIKKQHIIGVLAVSAFNLSDLLIPSIENLALHMSNALDLAEEREQRRAVEKNIVYRSQHDGLTGLHNRFFVEEAIDKLDNDNHLPFSVILGDINGLKLVNDGFGHRQGDALLRQAGKVIRSVSRKNDIIGRWGGDEFFLLLPKTNQGTAEQVCARIRDACFGLKKTVIPLSIALGVATKNKSHQNFNETIKEAEKRMYANKLLNEKSMFSAVLDSLMASLMGRGYETRKHSNHLKDIAVRLGHEFLLHENELDALQLLAMFHDIGKVAIPQNILRKRSPLSEKEVDEIKKHPEIGYRIIKALPDLAHVAEAVRTHHEWWNGQGYPRGLKRHQIPLISRIISVADAYEVMVSGDRPYKQKMTASEAIKELQRCAGSQFDPKVVRGLSQMVESA